MMSARDAYDLVGALALGVALVFVGDKLLAAWREQGVVNAAKDLIEPIYGEESL